MNLHVEHYKHSCNLYTRHCNEKFSNAQYVALVLIVAIVLLYSSRRIVGRTGSQIQDQPIVGTLLEILRVVVSSPLRELLLGQICPDIVTEHDVDPA